MNQVETRPTENVRASDKEPDICHYFCEICWPDYEKAEIALCGADLTDEKYTPNSKPEDGCAMCVEMLLRPCFRCGG